MGILDDAIRQHLDLKRQHGADDSEVKQLEDEAFGPPTRPGEPDFPESQEQPALGADQPGGDAPGEARDGLQADQGAEDATALLDTTAPAEEPAGGQAAEPESVEQPAPDDPAEDSGAFHDRASEAELDMDELDLDLDDEDEGEEMGEEVGDAEAAQPPEPAQPISEEHPIEAPEAVEHPIEAPLSDEPPPTGSEPVAEDDPDSEDEDVLEGTPEFLRDQPEDDELWFEQGEPKDFDF